MFFTELIQGFIIGLAIAAPVGPIGVLCIKRTLTQGWLVGVLSGLGAATADGGYGLIAGLGLTVISNFLINEHAWFQLIGGAFLCYLGLKTLSSKPATRPAHTRGQKAFSDYTSVLLLTLTNPMTILSFVAIFAGIGLSKSTHTTYILVLGVFLGSASWWLFLSTIINIFKDRLHNEVLTHINRISGGIILLFGFLAIYGFIIHL